MMMMSLHMHTYTTVLQLLYRSTAFRRGFCCHSLSIDELISAGDDKLFRQMSNESHWLHPLLPPQRNNKVQNSLRNCGHNYLLPQIESTLFKNSFINMCLFSYI